jgi:hypothetical protein
MSRYWTAMHALSLFTELCIFHFIHNWESNDRMNVRTGRNQERRGRRLMLVALITALRKSRKSRYLRAKNQSNLKWEWAGSVWRSANKHVYERGNPSSSISAESFTVLGFLDPSKVHCHWHTYTSLNLILRQFNPFHILPYHLEYLLIVSFLSCF